jgi:hypothetical protein
VITSTCALVIVLVLGFALALDQEAHLGKAAITGRLRPNRSAYASDAARAGASAATCCTGASATNAGTCSGAC